MLKIHGNCKKYKWTKDPADNGVCCLKAVFDGDWNTINPAEDGCDYFVEVKQ